MSRTDFFVRPLDVAFFGPPDAQSAGDTHYARSLFPPPPRAFQGLVRSRLLATATPELDLADNSSAARRERAQLVGEPNRLPEGWQIEGPLPAAWSDAGKQLVPWLPTPAFLYQRPADSEAPGQPPLRARFIEIAEGDAALGGVAGASRGANAQHVIAPRGFASLTPLGDWLDAANLRWALTGKGNWHAQGHSELPPMVKPDLRVGLSIDPSTRRAEDRMLYAVNQLRFDGAGGFLGGLDADLPQALSPDALTEGTAPFGRWNRLAALENVPQLTPEWSELVSGEHLPAEPAEETRFWLVAITPWRPVAPGSAETPELNTPVASSLELLGALLGKPVALGGYSMAERRARPNHNYVPAGSAWMFRVPGVTPARRGQIVRGLNGSHCLGPPEEARMGFGRVLVGIEWDA